MNITDEMVVAGAALIAKEHGSTVFDDDHEPYEFTEAEREQYRAEAGAVIEFAAPLIAAQALRLDAERVDRIVQALEAQDRSRPLVDYWHESMASRCWVRPDWDAIVKAVAGHLGEP